MLKVKNNYIFTNLEEAPRGTNIGIDTTLQIPGC